MPDPTEKCGYLLIAGERARQISKEGWTPEHDDDHIGGELVNAAVSYASLSVTIDDGQWAIRNWPWSEVSFKPSGDPIRNLVRAGALIAAEIDRLQRKADRG